MTLASRPSRMQAIGRPAARCPGTAAGAALLALLVLVALPAIAAAKPLVSSIRFGVHPDSTRIVLDVSEPVPFTAHALDDPYRLVIDLPEVTWRVEPGPHAQPRGLITGHRFGLYERGISRLVLDVGAPFKVVRTLTLPPETRPAHRLVVDLERVPLGAFARAPTQEAGARRTPPVRPQAPLDGRIAAAPVTPDAPVPRMKPTRPPPPVTATSLPMVVLDPGHGGVDPGAIGVGGLYEKDITLAMARELRDALLDTGRYRVTMTRDADVFLRLRERIQIAREARADLFVSLHADSLGSAEFRGASVYTLSDDASDEEAASLARKENKVDILAGTDLSNHDDIVTSILIDLAQRDTNNRSIAFAGTLAAELGQVTQMVRQTRRFAGFAVLRSPEVPSVLVELGYLSNAIDERQLSSPEHRERLAAAMVRAIERYFAERAS